MAVAVNLVCQLSCPVVRSGGPSTLQLGLAASTAASPHRINVGMQKKKKKTKNEPFDDLHGGSEDSISSIPGQVATPGKKKKGREGRYAADSESAATESVSRSKTTSRSS
eukprot:COSAG01_NODE_34553_length_545_cov_3.421525_1_plen_109_part_01